MTGDEHSTRSEHRAKARWPLLGFALSAALVLVFLLSGNRPETPAHNIDASVLHKAIAALDPSTGSPGVRLDALERVAQKARQRLLSNANVAPAWLSTANAFRESATGYLQERALKRAERALNQILLLPIPEEPSDVMRVITPMMQDAHFALATLFLATGRTQPCIDQAKIGLSLSEQSSVFRANLFAIRGMAHQVSGLHQRAAHDYREAAVIFEERLKHGENQ